MNQWGEVEFQSDLDEKIKMKESKVSCLVHGDL